MKIKIFLAVAIVLISLSIIMSTKSETQVVTKQYEVKLFSGNNVVGTWESYALGESDGQTLTFYIGSQTYPQVVKICGTYSVEQRK